MVIDSSILIAIAKKETDYERHIKILSESSELTMSATTLLETYLVLSYQVEESWKEIQHLIERSNVKIVEFSEQTMHAAIQAHKLFGKGQGHKAQLNYGDCMVYATAKSLNEPLLFVGNDFKHTDIEPVL